jgi:hypothetical protein
MAMAVLGYLPVRLAHDFFHPLAAAANGQCMAFRRPAYTAIGGHAAVQAAIVEDIQLAEHIKAAGLKLRVANGAGLVACRMYAGSQAAFDGYTKNILAGHHNRLSLLALSTLFHGSLFLFPWIWLLAGAPWPLPGWPGWPLALILTGVTLRGVAAAATRRAVADAITLPLSVLLFTAIPPAPSGGKHATAAYSGKVECSMSPDSPTAPILVLGAGIGGLSAAIRLAAAGHPVQILEQNDAPGGKMSQISADGFRWDTGPSVITMRPVFEELFATAGRRLEEYLTLLPVDPLTRYFYPDGTRLDATRDLSRLAEQIAAIDERDVEGFLDFLEYSARLHRIHGPVFISKPTALPCAHCSTCPQPICCGSTPG